MGRTQHGITPRPYDHSSKGATVVETVNDISIDGLFLQWDGSRLHILRSDID